MTYRTMSGCFTQKSVRTGGGGGESGGQGLPDGTHVAQLPVHPEINAVLKQATL